MSHQSITSRVESEHLQISPDFAPQDVEERIILKRTIIKYLGHDVQGAFFSVASVAAMAKLACEKGQDAIVFLEHLTNACQAFKHKLSNLIEYSRYDAGLKGTRLEPVQVRQILKRVLSESETHAIEENVKITLFISDSFPEYIHSDEQRLSVLCTNLLNAAIISSLKESITIKIHVEDNRCWSLAIENNGTDLIRGVWENLFSSKSIEDTALINNIRLALMLSRYIVEDILNGKMFILSNDGSTQLKVVLPLE